MKPRKVIYAPRSRGLKSTTSNMESLHAIKNRVKAVNNIGQISKAMEVVSATKMRKAQEVALNSRPYAFEALRILHEISRFAPVEHALLREREVQRTLIILVASDRGLAGSFNAQVFRHADELLRMDAHKDADTHQYCMITVGKKAHAYAVKNSINVVASYEGYGDYARVEDIDPLARKAIEGFMHGTWDRVITISTHFRSTLKQETVDRHVLPIDIEKIKETVRELIPEHGRYSVDGDTKDVESVEAPWTARDDVTEYLFEPSPARTLDVLLPHLVSMQLYHLILEANASEHSARMIAMKNASDNAQSISYDLTLLYNKARQAAITKELVEITATQSALT